jgi:hypothetical protein
MRGFPVMTPRCSESGSLGINPRVPGTGIRENLVVTTPRAAAGLRNS